MGAMLGNAAPRTFAEIPTNKLQKTEDSGFLVRMCPTTLNKSSEFICITL